jgi:hypothetical protein
MESSFGLKVEQRETHVPNGTAILAWGGVNVFHHFIVFVWRISTAPRNRY